MREHTHWATDRPFKIYIYIISSFVYSEYWIYILAGSEKFMYWYSDFYPKFGAEYRRLHNPKNGKKGKNSLKNKENSQFQCGLLIDFYE